MKNFSSFILCGSAALATALTCSAQIISNGDFSANGALFTSSNGYTGQGTNPSTITDWVSTGATGIGTSGSPFAPGGYSGTPTYFAFLQAGGTTLAQQVNLIAGATYSLSFDSAPRFGQGVYFGNQVGSADVTVSNSAYMSGMAYATAPATAQVYTGPTAFNQPFANTTISFTAEGTGTTTLSLNNTTPYGDDTEDFSNIVITQTGYVPEPSTYALVGLGVLALVCVARRSLARA